MLKNRLLGFTLLSIACLATNIYLPSTLAQGVPSRWAAKKYQVPKVGTPARREAAATRGGCPSDRAIALTPIEGIGATVSDYPTFYFSIPPLPANTSLNGEFKLNDGLKTVYTTQLPIAGTQRHTIAVPLANTPPSLPLALDRDYRWSFTLECNEDDSSGNPVVTGIIRRVAIDNALQTQIQQAKPEDLPGVYAAAEIWQDALMQAAQLHQNPATASQGKMMWQNLLKSVGLDPAIDR